MRALSLEEERKTTHEKLLLAQTQVHSISSEMENTATTAEQLKQQLSAAEQEKLCALEQAKREAQEREKLEKKLKLAEDALVRLDKALRDSGVKRDAGVAVSVSNIFSNSTCNVPLSATI